LCHLQKLQASGPDDEIGAGRTEKCQQQASNEQHVKDSRAGSILNINLRYLFPRATQIQGTINIGLVRARLALVVMVDRRPALSSGLP